MKLYCSTCFELYIEGRTDSQNALVCVKDTKDTFEFGDELFLLYSCPHHGPIYFPLKEIDIDSCKKRLVKEFNNYSQKTKMAEQKIERLNLLSKG